MAFLEVWQHDAGDVTVKTAGRGVDVLGRQGEVQVFLRKEKKGFVNLNILYDFFFTFCM